MLMVTNQLSFILTVAEVLMETLPSNPEAQSPASGLLWIALNKVGTWTLIQVITTYCQIHSDSVGCFKMNLHVVLILLIFVHLYRFVLGYCVFVVQFWSVLKWRCLRSPCAQPTSSSSCHLSSICSFLTLSSQLQNRQEIVLMTSSQQQVDSWTQQMLWWHLPSINYICFLFFLTTSVPQKGQQLTGNQCNYQRYLEVWVSVL